MNTVMNQGKKERSVTAKKKKVKKKPANKKLQKQCLKLAQEICKIRDNNTCQLHKLYPSIGIVCNGPLQADHGVSRACKKYFLDPRNLTWVCGSANRAKHYKLKSTDEAIRQIVIDREGYGFWDTMVKYNMSKTSFTDFNKVWWLEQIKYNLSQELIDLKVGRDMRNE